MFRKNVQGDVTHIYKLNTEGTLTLAARYKYDAWGKCEVENIGEETIGNINPIRYRGYYYDEETKLYYLNARYYDPEVGRFISADDTQFLEHNTINGLNLYVYCGNNPVMNVDPSGHSLISFLIAIIAGMIVGGVTKGFLSYVKGDTFLSGFLSGMLIGGALGAAFFLGGVTMLAIAGKSVAGFVTVGATATKLGLLAGSITLSTLTAMGAGMGAYVINESMHDREVSVSEMIRQGILTGLKGVVSFFTGMALAATGVFNYILEGAKLMFKERIATMIVRSTASFLIQFPWKMGLK